MISFNPFKKKEDDGFKLDDYSLPSLGESMPAENTQPSFDSPNSLPSLDGSPQSGVDFPQKNNSSISNNSISSSQEIPSMATSNDMSVPGISSSMPSSFSPTDVNEEAQGSSPVKGDFSQDLTKAKLDTIATKIELMEARQQAMNQKIEQIYEMLAMEVSPETKKRLKIKSMMDNIRDS